MPLVRLPSGRAAHLICCLFSGTRGRVAILVEGSNGTMADATCKSGKQLAEKAASRAELGLRAIPRRTVRNSIGGQIACGVG